MDHRADLFAAGATLFEMVAGERAFGGRSSAEVTHHIMYDRLPLLPATVRSAAPRLQFVLERAMGKHPEDRFSSGHEMAEALRQVLRDAGARQHAHRAREPATPQPGAPRTPAPSQTPSAAIQDPDRSQSCLRAVEERLKAYVGPIADVLVQRSQSRSRSAIDLCAELGCRFPTAPTDKVPFREVASLTRALRPCRRRQASC